MLSTWLVPSGPTKPPVPRVSDVAEVMMSFRGVSQLLDVELGDFFH